MMPHTATPVSIAVTTVLSAVTELVKNPIVLLKTDFAVFFLLPIVENVYAATEGIKNPCGILFVIE